MTKQKTEDERIEDLKKRVGAASAEKQEDGTFIFKDTAGNEVEKGSLDEIDSRK